MDPDDIIYEFSEENDDKKGYIYILTNESHPGIIKIGITTDINTRLKSLYNTSTPFPFKCYALFETKNIKSARFIEKVLHKAFTETRVNNDREFFRKAPENIVDLIEQIKGVERKVDLSEINNTKQKTRSNIPKPVPQQPVVPPHNIQRNNKNEPPPFSFLFVGIPEGSKLTFSKDNSEECFVASHSVLVVYNNSDHAIGITRLTRGLLMNLKINMPEGIQGIDYWKYNGKLLSDLYSDAINKYKIKS